VSNLYCIALYYLVNIAFTDIELRVRFLVDDVPIRRYPRKSGATFPLRPMWLYGSIWDASSWATEDGKYKADYKYQPFVAKYSNFKASGCSAYAPRWCHPVSASPYRSGGLTRQQDRAMRWVQRYLMVYNYCQDPKRDHSLTPECWGWSVWSIEDYLGVKIMLLFFGRENKNTVVLWFVLFFCLRKFDLVYVGQLWWGP